MIKRLFLSVLIAVPIALLIGAATMILLPPVLRDIVIFPIRSTPEFISEYKIPEAIFGNSSQGAFLHAKLIVLFIYFLIIAFVLVYVSIMFNLNRRKTPLWANWQAASHAQAAAEGHRHQGNIVEDTQAVVLKDEG